MKLAKGKGIVFTNKRIKLLLFLSILYLAVPQAVYMGICLRKRYAVIVLALTAAALWGAWKVIPESHHTFMISWKVLIIPELLIWAVFLFSGMGGVCGKQMGDYSRSNAILSDLVSHEWPVMYNEHQNMSVMNYYIAYFIPGACIGRLTGSFHVAELVTLFWSVIGLSLGMFLIFLVTKVVRLRTLWLFFCWAGLDCVGQVIVSGTLFGGTEHIEHWANISNVAGGHIANYNSMATGFLWAPQHYIPVIIVTFFMLYMVKKGIYRLCMLLCILMLFWTPLVVVGILPFAVVLAVYEKGRLAKFISWPDCLGAVGIGIPSVLYFLSMNFSTFGSSQEYLRGIRWLLNNWTIFLLFAVLEFGIAGYIIWKAGVKTYLDRLLCAAAVFTMTVILFVDWGAGHDFSMRASEIPWFVLFSYVPGILEDARPKWKKALLLYMTGATITSFTEYARIIEGVIEHPLQAERFIVNKENTLKGWGLQYQYVGSPDSFFFSRLCNVFDVDAYRERLKNGAEDYLLYSDDLWNIYYYEEELYFYVKGEDAGDAAVSVSRMYEDGRPEQTAEYKVNQMIHYGTLSNIHNLGKYNCALYDWTDIHVSLHVKDRVSEISFSLEDLRKWAEKHRWEYTFVKSNFSDVNWDFGVLKDGTMMLLDNTSIYDQTLQGKYLRCGNGEKILITGVEYGSDFTRIYLERPVPTPVNEETEFYVE